MLERKEVRKGRPREIKGGGKMITLYLDSARVEDFRKLCAELDISISEGIRQLVEQELEKNEAGVENPIGISFNLNNKTTHEHCWLNLDQWLPVSNDEIKERLHTLVPQQRGTVMKMTKKIIQMNQLIQEGKITL